MTLTAPSMEVFPCLNNLFKYIVYFKTNFDS